MSDHPTPFEQQLAAELGAPPDPPAIPAAVDDAIVALARARAQEIAQTRRRRRRWAVPTAVAAAAAVVLVVALPLTWSAAPVAPAAAGPDDVNHDGRVDILDAYALARAAEQGGVPAGEAERVALAAVALGPGGAR